MCKFLQRLDLWFDLRHGFIVKVIKVVKVLNFVLLYTFLMTRFMNLSGLSN